MIRFSLPQGCRATSLALCFLLILPQVASAADATLSQILDEAKSLMRSDNPQAAYELLIASEDRFTGTDSFDYLLGVAALDSGNDGDAIFSLQRLVVSKPDFAGARMELARAYYEVGDNELARTEFERIMAEDPPPKVRAAVDQYMEAIDARARAYTASTQWHLDMGAGYDDNPAAATADDQFLSFILDSKNVEQSSAFAEIAAGVVYSRPMTPEAQLSVNGRLSHRSNPSAHYVDPSTAELGAMLNWQRDTNAASVGVSATKSLLDGKSNKDDLGLMASYSRAFSARWSADIYGRVGRLEFERELSVLDVDQQMAGLGLTFHGEASRFSGGLVAAEDDARETGSPYSNDGTGFRLSGLWVRPGGRSFSLEAMAMEIDYDDPFFGIDREDDLYSVYLSHAWQRFPSPGWTLTLRLGYSERDSTISLYEFDRLEAGILIRKVID